MYQSQRLSNSKAQLDVKKLLQTSQLHHGLSLKMKINIENMENKTVKEKNRAQKVLDMDSRHKKEEKEEASKPMSFSDRQSERARK